MPNLLTLAIVLGTLDIVAKSLSQYNRLVEIEMGLNWEKGFWLCYLTFSIIVSLYLHKFKKWAYISIMIIFVLNVLTSFYFDLRELNILQVIATFLGFYFLFIFSIVILIINRKLYFE